MIELVDADVVGPDDFVMEVDAAGGARSIAADAAAWDGVSVIVLTGPEKAHYGVIVGSPCTLVADETSPLRFMGIGEIFPACAPDLRAMSKTGRVAVVLTWRGKLPDRVYDIMKTRSAHVRLVYATGERAPSAIVENTPPPGVQLPLIPRSR